MGKIVLSIPPIMKKLAMISAILVLLVIAWCALWYVIDEKPYSQERLQAKQELTLLLHDIQLGDTSEEVAKTYHERSPKNLQLFRHENAWTIGIIPMGMISESDWQLYIDFTANTVSAIYIRSINGPYKPRGSPDDKGNAPPVYRSE